MQEQAYQKFITCRNEISEIVRNDREIMGNLIRANQNYEIEKVWRILDRRKKKGTRLMELISEVVYLLNESWPDSSKLSDTEDVSEYEQRIKDFNADKIDTMNAYINIYQENLKRMERMNQWQQELISRGYSDQ